MKYLVAFMILFAVSFAPNTAIAQICEGEASQAQKKPGDGFGCIPFTIEAYAYPTSPNQINGAVFLAIQNHMPKPLRILNAQSDVAEKIELHTHNMDGDMMMMRAVKMFEVPGLEKRDPDPMGDHIMLLGLKQKLEAGKTFPLTLELERWGKAVLDVKIGFFEK